jgi:hypothetical protein
MYDDWIEWENMTDQQQQRGLKLPLRDSTVLTVQDWKDQPFMAMRSAQFYIAKYEGSIWNDGQFALSPFSRDTLRQLYSMGADFLYGMLFRELLEFHPQISPPELHHTSHSDNNNNNNNNDDGDDHGATTYVLHSRHFTDSDTGIKALAEFECLHDLLGRNQPEKSQQQHKSCIIYLMSDRPKTIEILKRHIQYKYPQCMPMVATHHVSMTTQTANNDDNKSRNTTNAANEGHYQEHGVWAGMGFMQDLMLGSQARDGFIGHCYRSSSQLLRELIEYDRTMEMISHGGTVPSPLPSCCLPSN